MSTSDQNPPADSAPRNPGDTIAGCYVLTRRLQAADGADVWLAQDEVLGKDVSLHFVPQAAGKDSKALQELRLDIKRNRQLIHPNILRVYDLVEEPEFAAVSMDTFEGDSLGRKIGQGALPAAEVHPWALQLAATLEEAHKINVLHRDLSPANLFLTSSGKLLVANFGISRTIHDALVRAGGAGSGDAFASPQLRAGNAASRADDIYAFGAILFSALTGKSPAATADAAGALQSVQAPATWVSLISACLNASPESRPQAAAELARQLSATPAPAAGVAAPASAPAAPVAAVETPTPAVAPTSTPAPVAPEVKEKTEAVPTPVPELKLATPPPPPQPESVESTPAPVVDTSSSAPAIAATAVTAAAAVAAESAPAPVVPALISSAEAPVSKSAAPVESPKVVETPASAGASTESLKPAKSVAPVAPVTPAVPTPEKEPEHEPVVSISKPVEPVVELKPAAAAAPAPGIESKPASVPAVESSTRARESAPSAAESPVPLRPWEEPAKEAVKEPKKTEPSRPSSALTSPRGPARRGSDSLSAPHYPEESRFPVTTLAAAAAVIVVIAIIYHFTKSGGGNVATNPADQQPEKTELRPPSSTPVATPANEGPVVQTKPVAVVATPTPRPATPAPASTPNPNLKVVAERTAMLEKAKAEAETAEKNYAALQKQQQEAETGLADIQKSIGEKTASVKTLKKAADEVAVQRKKLEDDKKAADAAAAEAQKAAAEKARLADISAKALLDMEQVNAEKIAAPEKAEKEIADLQKTLEEKQRSIADQAKAVAQAETARQQQLAAIAEHQREIDRIKSTDAEAQKQKDVAAAAAAASAASADAQKQKDAAAAAAAAADAQKQKDAAAMAAAQKEKDGATAEKSKIDNELAEMQRIFKLKMDELEAKRKQLENPAATPAPAPAPNVSVRATPAPATPAPIALATPPPVPSTPIKMNAVEAPAMAKLTTPAPIVPSQGAPLVTTNANTTAAPAVGGNSLGMKFVPVGDVDFCVWQTRVKDFEVFAKAVNLRSNSWKGPGFKQGPEHPVVNVSWTEAVAFCKWLTDKEHKEETLPATQFYRLPTDLEWSRAVGLPEETGKSPELRDMGIPDVYPWGTAWPPPQGAGNYTGEETGSDVAIKGYDDGFAWTAPVGSFPPNKFGIFDMGGNVWQWCMDAWNAESKAKVLRGASWYNGALKLSLLSSCRVHAAPDSSTDNYGFRIVRAKEDKAARR